MKNGVVLPHGNSFALQFQRDMKECYRMVEDFYSVASDLQHRYVKLFENEESNKDGVEQLLLVDLFLPQVFQTYQEDTTTRYTRYTRISRNSRATTFATTKF